VKLRPYQQTIVDDVRAAIRSGKRKVLIQLPTGGGKTALASYMVHGAAQDRGHACLWLTHRRELINQASRTFHNYDIPHGIIQGGSYDARHLVQIGSVQTVARRLDRIAASRMICWDEVHHLGAAQWDQIFQHYPHAVHIGLTATPQRLDGKGLGRWFDTMVEGPSVSNLIEIGALSQYRMFAPSTPDLTGIKTIGGDYNGASLAQIMDKPSVVGDALDHYQRHSSGKRAVIFAVSIAASQNIVAQFRGAGIAAEHVDGTTPSHERDAAIARFVSGETLVLSNVDLFGEGFDVPAIETVIDLAPTKSLSKVLQRWGRALRPADGKDHALLFDHAGNSLRHGLPDDEREWSLDDKIKTAGPRKANEQPVRQCPDCFRVYRPAPVCPGCGAQAPITAREVEQIKGELAEVTQRQERVTRSRQEGQCQTLDDWQKLARERGYAPGWAYHRWQARQRRAA
jgi:superfamily II DNA or RNA helicase